MATKRTAPFEELIKLASDFVTSQKGIWDHNAWVGFLSDVQQKGIEISAEMQSKLGDLLEAVKEYQMAVFSTEDIEKAMSTLLNESLAFIQRQKGVWGHAEWEDFVRTMQQNTRTWSEGMEAYLGGVLESLKVFYRVPSAAPPEKSEPVPTAAPVRKVVPAARKNALRKASPAQTRKKSGTKKKV